MSAHSQGSGPTSDDTPLPPDPLPIFQLNQARRDRVSAELDALRNSFLEWPTVEGLEAFVEKKAEFSEMMAEMIGFYRAVTREQHAYLDAQQRVAEQAEERRLQEFQRALERMDPAEAEATQRAERERALRLQKERQAETAALDAEIAHARARVREKYSKCP